MKRWIFAILIFNVPPLQANVGERYYFTAAGRVSILSDAPLELIAATSGQMTGSLDPVKRTFTFIVPVASFRGFNTRMQSDQFNDKFMESAKYPAATFSGKLPYDFSELKKGMQLMSIPGILDIHGVKKERNIPVSLFVTDQMLVVQSRFIVPLADHRIEVPALLAGEIAAEIKIEVKALMKIRFGDTGSAR